MPISKPMSRRGFLQGTAAVGGALVLGFHLPGKGLEAAEGAQAINAWLRIAQDNSVTILVAKSEMGQGITTSLPMLVAEEAEVDWKRVGFELAPGTPAYASPRGERRTGGSTSVRISFGPLRQAGAAAREMLRQAAANRWKVPLSETKAEQGAVLHTLSPLKATYGELAGEASRLPAPKDVPLKLPKDWSILGKPVARLDIPSKVNGTAVFGMDVRLPGMLVGTVRACPVLGGKLKKVDDQPAKAVRGVKAVVPLSDAVIVVADSYWNAHLGLEALRPEWDLGENAKRQEAGNRAELLAALNEPGNPVPAEGDAVAAVSKAAKTVEATYLFPFLSHATMEPMNATASVTADGVEIWAPTQAQSSAQSAVSRVLGIALEKVKVNTTFLGGGFGRRSQVDFILHAALASKAAGAPVQVIWSREEDMRHGFYRPSTALRVKAGVDAQGKPVGLLGKVAGPSIMSGVFPQIIPLQAPGVEMKDGVDPTSVEGLADTLYDFGALRVEYTRKELGVPVSIWRAVGHTFTAFVVETFVDELAHGAGRDAVEYRRMLLAKQPRALAVLNKAAEAGNWGKPLPRGRARGVAIHSCFGSTVAQLAEVSAEGNAVRVHRITTVVDCGRVVNPDTVTAQMESSVAFALTATYFGEHTIADGRIAEANFPDYPILKMAQMPTVDVHILAGGGERLGGIGEPAVPPVGPAVANALFTLTGKRIRVLPLVKQGFTVA